MLQRSLERQSRPLRQVAGFTQRLEMQRSFERGHCLSLWHQPFSVSVLTNSISSSSRDVGLDKGSSSIGSGAELNLAVAVGLGTKSLIGSGAGAGIFADGAASLVDFVKHSLSLNMVKIEMLVHTYHMCSYDMYTFYTYVFSIMVSLTSPACTLLTTNKAAANKESKSFMICYVCVCLK